MNGVFLNSGQICTAGSRILVESSIHDQFVESLVEATETMKVGPALEEDTGMGPVVSKEQLDRVTGVHRYRPVRGGRGTRPAGESQATSMGATSSTTIFTGVRNDMRIAQEEIFGPVAAVDQGRRRR